VGDTAGQLTHGFHFLGLAELLFTGAKILLRPLALGDVQIRSE